MKTTKVLAAVSALAIVTLTLALAATPTRPTDYLIKVTTLTPGKEVKFKVATLINNAEAPFESVTHKTPYEMSVTGQAASALFRVIGDGKIQVEMRGTRDGKAIFRSTATGRAVSASYLQDDRGGSITSF